MTYEYLSYLSPVGVPQSALPLVFELHFYSSRFSAEFTTMAGDDELTARVTALLGHFNLDTPETNRRQLNEPGKAQSMPEVKSIFLPSTLCFMVVGLTAAIGPSALRGRRVGKH
jgi:hypothetical protein